MPVIIESVLKSIESLKFTVDVNFVFSIDGNLKPYLPGLETIFDSAKVSAHTTQFLLEVLNPNM